MKIFKPFFSFCLLLITLSCSESDPCRDVICENLEDNFCTDGICACEAMDWSYVDWNFECTNCSSQGFIELFIDVEVNGVTISDLTLRGSSWTTRINKKLIAISGTVPYKITSGSVVLEEGNLNFQTCVQTQVSSKFSI